MQKKNLKTEELTSQNQQALQKAYMDKKKRQAKNNESILDVT